MRKTKFILAFLLILSTLLPIFSSCGQCEHTWDEGYVAKAATDLEVGYSVHTCTKCKETTSREIPKLAHTNHNYSKTQWGSDENYHWLTCDFTDCTATSGKSAHTFYQSSDGGYMCEICKYVSAVQHNFGSLVGYDKDCHWLICADKDCPVISAKYPHSFGSGLKCEGCDYSKSAHQDHLFTEWAFDQENHWLICNYEGCGKASEKRPHIWLENGDGTTLCRDCKIPKPNN